MIRTDTGLWLTVPFDHEGAPRRGSMYLGNVGDVVQRIADEAEGRYLLGGCIVAAPAFSPDQIERIVAASLAHLPKGEFDSMLPEFRDKWLTEPGSRVRALRALSETGQPPCSLTGGVGRPSQDQPF